MTVHLLGHTEEFEIPMEKSQNIDYRGIGEGITTTTCRGDLSSRSSISLTDDWQTLSSHRTPEYNPNASASTAQSSLKSELGSESSEVSQEAWHETLPIPPTAESYLPLERYCCHLEPHEQLAVGQTTDRGSPTQLAELDESLYATARVLPGCTSRSSAPSPSSSSSPRSEDNDMPHTLEIDPTLKDSSEPQAALLEEQAKHLHKIAKLRRRLRAEGKGRMKKPARVRKRSRLTEKSTETGQRGIRSLE